MEAAKKAENRTLKILQLVQRARQMIRKTGMLPEGSRGEQLAAHLAAHIMTDLYYSKAMLRLTREEREWEKRNAHAQSYRSNSVPIEKPPVWGSSFRIFPADKVRNQGATPIEAGDLVYIRPAAGEQKMSPTFDEEARQVEERRAGHTQITDPVLVQFQTPKNLSMRTWKEVAKFYHSVAHQYALKNNRHIDELALQQRKYQEWKVDHLERSTKEYARMQEIVKQRDDVIRTLKDAIHVLTKRGI